MDPFAAVADPVRREILLTLRNGPARVVDLADQHPISRPAVSRHLRVLLEAGLISAESTGRERHYALRPEGLNPVASLISELRTTPRITEDVFAGLDLEVRRTVRDHRTAPTSDRPAHEEPA